MTEPRGTQSIDIPDYAGLLDKYEALQRDRDDIHKNLVTVRVALADMESERHGLRAQVKMRDEEIAGLKRDMGADLVAALRRERAQLDNQLASARKERAQFFADASRNATEREEQRTRAEKAEAELAKLIALARAWSAADFQYARAALCGESDPLQAAVEAYNSTQAALLAAVGITEYDKLSAVISAGGCEHRKELDRLYAPKPCAGCDLTMPLDFAKVCDACKNSLPHALWLLFTATPMNERRLAGEAIWHILTARNRQNDDRTELRSEIEHLQRVSKAAHERAEKAEQELDSWRAATKCKTPEEAGKLLEDLEWFEDADATRKELKQLRQLVSARPIRARWNLNNKITVRFTNRGKNLWRSYVEQQNRLIPDRTVKPEFTGHEDAVTLQMWEFIHAFASPNCWMNGADPVVNMHVEIEEVEPGSDPFFAPDVLSMIQRLAVHPIAKMQRCRIRNQAGFILVGEGADSEERIIAAIKELREERDEARQELAGVRAHLDFRKTILDSQAYVIRTKHKKARAWKRSARGFRTKAKIFHSALLLAHKERDATRAALDAFTRADTQPQIAGFLVANGEAVRLENGNVLPADPQTQITYLRRKLEQQLAAAQGDREMRKELGDIMGGISPKNPDKIPSWPLLHNTARGLRRLADQAGEGNSHLWKMVAAAVGDEWKKYHTAGTSMAGALCATITGIRQRLAEYERPFNNLTLLEIEERRAADEDCAALINAIRIERGNVDALKETLQRIARILNFGTAGKADSLVECVGRVHAAWLQARKDLAEHRSNVDMWAYTQLIGRKNAEKRAGRAEQKAAAAALRLAEATERCQRDASRLGAVLHWANETDNAIVRGLALGQLP